MRGFFGGLGALTASDLFLPSEISFFQKVWPTVRVAARWTDPSWASIGYPNGPPISPVSNSIMGAVWGDVRRAAQFSDINWAAVPELTQAMILAAGQLTHPPPVASPVPEVTQSPPTASAQPVTPTTTQQRTPEQSPTAQPVGADSPAAAPVPELTSPLTDPGYGYVSPPSTPVYGSTPPPSFDWASLLGPALPTPNEAPGTALPAVKTAGMFGGNSLLMVGLAIGAAVLFGSHGKKGGKRRRRRA